MDNFRRSNVSLSQLNPSHAGSPSRVPSVYESRARYESEQVDLMRYLRWVIALIGVIIAVLFLKAILTEPLAARCTAPASNAKTRLKEYFSPPAAATPTTPATQTRPVAGDGFWSYFLPNWGYSELGAVQERIRDQRFSVNPALPELPSLDSVRAHPARFNLSLDDLASTPAERLTATFPPAQVLQGLQTLVGGEELPEDARPGDVDRRRKELSAQMHQFEELERRLQQNTTADLLLRLNDLRGSAQALIAKRSQLNELRAQFLLTTRSLATCEARERDQDQALAADRHAAEELRERVGVLEKNAEELRQRIEEKEKSLNDSDRQNRDRILALTTRATQLKASLGRKPAIEKSIAEKRRRLSQLSIDLDRLRARLAELTAQRAGVDTEFQQFMAQPRELQEELLAAEANRKVLSMRLNSMLTHRQIKNFLDTLLPAKEKKSTLESIIDGKLSEEKELLEIVARYEREGRLAPDSPDRLKAQIERHESNFQAILQKYAEWQKVVEEYGASDDDITVVQEQVRELDRKIHTLQQKTGAFKGKQTAFAERLLSLDKGLESTRGGIATAEAEVKGLNDWIAQAEQDLVDWQQAWATLQQEIAARNSEFIAYKANIEQSFGDLDKQRDALAASLDAQRGQLREVSLRLKTEGDRLAAARAECTAVKAVYVKVAEMLPGLQALVAHDLRALEQLKGEVRGLIEPYTLLPA